MASVPQQPQSLLAFAAPILAPLSQRPASALGCGVPPLTSSRRPCLPQTAATPHAVLTPSETPPRQHDQSAEDDSIKELRLRPTTSDPDWLFYDVARMQVCGGCGGNGIVAFRREKGVPRGGPAGGSGGSGGSVILAAISSANTLANFRSAPTFQAADGVSGTGKARHGACARHRTVAVPMGTVVRDTAGRVLADLSSHGDTFLAASGGRGGRGNLAFKTATNRAPCLAENGEPGAQRWLHLELKLVADVGLVGFPNAGKSTLLRTVTNAMPKVADYPFTTIVPNLGVVDGVYGADGLVIADVPGLIAGAHRGVGMGLAFLRHIERCRVIVHLLDASLDGVVDRYMSIRQELELFSQKVAQKKEVILVNKADLPGVRESWESELRDGLTRVAGHRRIAIVSALSGEGLPDALRRLHRLVDAEPEDADIVVDGDIPEFGEPPATVDVVEQGVFRIGGYKVERAFHMTNWDYVESIDRFQRILVAVGVNRQLIKAGVKDGDTIVCFDREFEYYREENIYSAAAALDGFVE